MDASSEQCANTKDTQIELLENALLYVARAHWKEDEPHKGRAEVLQRRAQDALKKLTALRLGIKVKWVDT